MKLHQLVRNSCLLLNLFIFLTAAHAGFDPAEMWAIDAGDIRRVNCGYEEAPVVDTYLVYWATPKKGAYHHHPIITYHDGKFYAAFSEGRNGEDGPGQRVLVSVSDDGKSWSQAVHAVPSLSDYSRDWRETGVNSTPLAWIELDGRLWVTSFVNDVTGFTKKGSDIIVSQIRESGLQNHNVRLGRIASEVFPDGSVGDRFWISDIAPQSENLLPSINYPAISAPRFSDIRDRFLEAATTHETRIGPSSRLANTKVAEDGHRLTEHTSYQRPDGKWVQLARDLNASHRLYYAESNDGESFSTPVQTNIPDTPALTQAGILPDGRIFIVGNFIHNPDIDDVKSSYKRYPLAIALSNDGKYFDQAWSIRSTPTARRFFVGGDADGYSYPHVVIVGGDLWVIYSNSKQDIYVSRVPWKTLR